MKTLPEGWNETKIGEIGLIDSGQGAPQGDKWYNGNKIFVKAGHLNNLTEGMYVGDYCQKISNEAISHYSLKEYPADSIVFPKSGMSVKTDNIAILKYDSYVVNHLAIVKVNDELCSAKYLYYLLKKVKISNLSLNDSYPSIRLQDIKNFNIPLPPLPIQKKIAAILEKAEWLKVWRKEADRLTDEYLKSTFLEIFGDPGKNTKGWDEVKLGSVLIENPKNGLYKPSTAYGGGTPILRIDSFYDGKITTIDGLKRLKCTNEEIENFNLEIGDVMINRVNSLEYLGKCGLVENLSEDTVYESNMMRIRLKTDVINSKYLTTFLCSKYVKNQILSRAKKAVNQASINQGDVKSLLILLPPLSLQQKFSEIMNKVAISQKYQEESRIEINNLFNALMQKAFKGELAC